MPFSSESSSDIEDTNNVGVEGAISGADMQLFLQRRKEEMCQEFKEQQYMLQNETGKLVQVAEGVFLDSIAKCPRAVAHFYLDDFEPCRTLNEMLENVAKQHPETKFVKLVATEAPWFVAKFKIKTLPSTVVFVDGKIGKKFIGLEEFGNEFPNEIDLKRALAQCGAIHLKEGELTRKQGIFGFDDTQQSDSDW